MMIDEVNSTSSSCILSGT